MGGNELILIDNNYRNIGPPQKVDTRAIGRQGLLQSNTTEGHFYTNYRDNRLHLLFSDGLIDSSTLALRWCTSAPNQ